MMDRLDGIERDYAELEASLGDPDIVGDQNKLRDASRLYKQMTPIVQSLPNINRKSISHSIYQNLLLMFNFFALWNKWAK
jgi:protein subunit release factor A